MYVSLTVRSPEELRKCTGGILEGEGANQGQHLRLLHEILIIVKAYFGSLSDCLKQGHRVRFDSDRRCGVCLNNA